MERDIGGYEFRFAATIEPRRDGAGGVATYNHSAPEGKRPNLHGRGPFCRFALPGEWPYAGVYVITADEAVVYVGECENLSRRFGPEGYGSIAGRKCLSDGQSTNCKVNAHVAVAAAGGGRIQVRFVATDRRMEVERQLIAELKPPWNSRGGRYSTAVPPSQGGPISMPMAEDFRRALHAVFAEGERSGAPSVTVHAGNLHRRVGGHPGSNQGRTQETEIYAR